LAPPTASGAAAFYTFYWIQSFSMLHAASPWLQLQSHLPSTVMMQYVVAESTLPGPEYSRLASFNSYSMLTALFGALKYESVFRRLYY